MGLLVFEQTGVLQACLAGLKKLLLLFTVQQRAVARLPSNTSCTTTKKRWFGMSCTTSLNALDVSWANPSDSFNVGQVGSKSAPRIRVKFAHRVIISIEANQFFGWLCTGFDLKFGACRCFCCPGRWRLGNTSSIGWAHPAMLVWQT